MGAKTITNRWGDLSSRSGRAFGLALAAGFLTAGEQPAMSGFQSNRARRLPAYVLTNKASASSIAEFGFQLSHCRRSLQRAQSTT